MTAIIRGDNQTIAQNAAKKGLFDLTAADLEQYDAVADAFGAWTEDVLPQHSTSLKHLCDILFGKKQDLTDGICGGKKDDLCVSEYAV